MYKQNACAASQVNCPTECDDYWLRTPPNANWDDWLDAPLHDFSWKTIHWPPPNARPSPNPNRNDIFVDADEVHKLFESEDFQQKQASVYDYRDQSNRISPWPYNLDIFHRTGFAKNLVPDV